MGKKTEKNFDSRFKKLAFNQIRFKLRSRLINSGPYLNVWIFLASISFGLNKFGFGHEWMKKIVAKFSHHL